MIFRLLLAMEPCLHISSSIRGPVYKEEVELLWLNLGVWVLVMPVPHHMPTIAAPKVQGGTNMWVPWRKVCKPLILSNLLFIDKETRAQKTTKLKGVFSFSPLIGLCFSLNGGWVSAKGLPRAKGASSNQKCFVLVFSACLCTHLGSTA